MSDLTTSERDELRATTRAVLARSLSLGARQDCQEIRHDAELWNTLSRDLGVAGMLIPEAHGGLGLSLQDAFAVVEEAGRACYDGPVLMNWVIAPLLLQLAQQNTYADATAIVNGSLASVTGVHQSQNLSEVPLDVTAARTPGRWSLTGSAPSVLHGREADVLYVVADSAEGRGVWRVQAKAPGHERRGLLTLDLTRMQSAHRFIDVPAELVMAPGTVDRELRLLSALSTVALAAEQVGAIEHLLEVTLAYVIGRFQFGRAIGSFQAVKHRCVDMAIAREGARASYEAAAVAAEQALGQRSADHESELTRLASIAGAYCSDAFLQVASTAMQLHGGISMTWECDLHFYLRRARSALSLFGAPAHHRRELAAAIGLSLDDSVRVPSQEVLGHV